MKFTKVVIGPFIRFNAEEDTVRFAANEIDALQKSFGWQWISMYGIRWKDKYRTLNEVAKE